MNMRAQRRTGRPRTVWTDADDAAIRANGRGEITIIQLITRTHHSRQTINARADALGIALVRSRMKCSNPRGYMSAHRGEANAMVGEPTRRDGIDDSARIPDGDPLLAQLRRMHADRTYA